MSIVTASQTGAGRAALRRAVLLSGHYYASRRRANFHFLADALARAGWQVTFATVQIGPLSRLRGDARMDYPVLAEKNRLVPVRPGLSSYVWYTPFHPVHTRSALLDRVTAPLFQLYGSLPLGALGPVLEAAHLVIVESTAALLLVDRIRRLNRSARLVYRVSDDVRGLGLHLAVRQAEERAAPLFDLISCPSRTGLRRFAGLGNAVWHPHGIDGAAFAMGAPTPFEGPRNAVSIGHSFYDPELVALAAPRFPLWTFHVVGRVPRVGDAPNIRWYDEIPFAATVPFLRHADIGLAPYLDHPGAEGLADSSLKLTQYTWCGLPSLAPEFATRPDRPHIVGYRPGDAASIQRAFLAAGEIDRRTISRAGIPSWDELAAEIAGPLPVVVRLGQRAGTSR